MVEWNRLGKNIKAFREAYGETEEELGEILSLGRSTISNYESGTRTPNVDVLRNIANHYGVTIGDIESVDFSSLYRFDIDTEQCRNFIVTAYPIFLYNRNISYTDDSTKAFTQAYEFHKRILSNIKNRRNNDSGFEHILDAVELYGKAYGSDESNIYALANAISLLLLFLHLTIVPTCILNRDNAAIKMYEKKERVFNDFTNDDRKDLKEIENDLSDEDFQDELKETLKELRKSKEFYEFSDYIVAVLFCFNLANRDLDLSQSMKIGLELMKVLMELGNKYAEDYLKILVRKVIVHKT